MPAAFSGRQWLPAKSLTLEQSWSADPPQARVGEPLTRTLRLRAAGLTSGQLPELASPADPLKSYPDRPILDEQDRPEGVSGSRQEKIVYIPPQAGTYSLPAVAIPWWNTETDRMEVARLPATEIQVLPAAGGGTASPPPATAPAPTAELPPTAAPAPAVPSAPAPAAVAVAPAQPAPPAAAAGQPSPTPWGGIPWHWVSLGLALAWAATAAAWGLTRRRAGAAGTRLPPGPPARPARGKRLATCAGPAPPAIPSAPGRRCWPGWPPATPAARRRWRRWRPRPARPCGGNSIALSRSLYGRSGEVWSGSALWQALRAEQDAGKSSAGNAGRRPGTAVPGDAGKRLTGRCLQNFILSTQMPLPLFFRRPRGKMKRFLGRIMRILIIEDDTDTAAYLAKGLTESGHLVHQARDGREGLFLALDEEYEVMVVDRMLPGMDGLAIIQALRAARKKTPILILSALGEVDNRVQGLRAGGDDYLVKPFAYSELLARLEALVRRTEAEAPQTVMKVEDLEMDLLTRTVRRAGRPIELQQREFRLLEYLMRHAGQVVTRTMLLENVWDYHFDPQTNVIDVHVSRLRRKIDKDFDPPLLQTVRGAGYVLRVA